MSASYTHIQRLRGAGFWLGASLVVLIAGVLLYSIYLSEGFSGEFLKYSMYAVALLVFISLYGIKTIVDTNGVHFKGIGATRPLHVVKYADIRQLIVDIDASKAAWEMDETKRRSVFRRMNHSWYREPGVTILLNNGYVVHIGCHEPQRLVSEIRKRMP